MGIPVGWNIARDEVKEKDVLRADVTGSRSPIRRRARTSRLPRNHALSASDTDALVDSNTSRFAQVVDHPPRLFYTRTYLPPAPPVPQLREGDFDREELRPRSLSIGDGATDIESPLPALTPGFAPAGPRTRDHPGEHNEWSRGFPVARSRRAQPRGSSLRPTSGNRTESGDFNEGAPPRLQDHTRDRHSWTFGRRHAPYARIPREEITVRYSDRLMPSDDEYPGPPYTTVSHPPLRRVGHRRIVDGPLPSSSLANESWSPASTLDGLGDRDRSNSVSSTSSNLPWQTFLNTVVPDPVAPTAESSFASAAASASFTASSSRASSSNSNSAASEHTHVTIPSRRPSPGARLRGGAEINESFARACESSDEGESTASDTEDEVQANPLSRRRMRPSYFADEPPTRRRHGRNVMEQGSDARRYVRSYYLEATSHGILYSLGGPDEPNRQADRPVDGLGGVEQSDLASFATADATLDEDEVPATTPSPLLDQEMRDARSLLERFRRRDDIGEDFWASVGLTRSFADEVEGVQEIGRF